MEGGVQGLSKVIDNRIVEMSFDNSKFEKNVKESMGTLSKLNSKLKETESTKALEGLDKASKGIDLSGITDALEQITDRFSTMGIVGMTVIQNLTNTAVNFAKTLVNDVFNKIYTGGLNRAQNIEKAKFQLEGLGIAYKDVAGAIDYAVTNTAYSLDAAAQAAAMLAASGLDYKEVVMTHEADGKALTKMDMALRAVSGVAAQTQTDYEIVARYFQDIANAGEVTGATLTHMTQVLNLPVRQDLAKGLKAIADGSYEASDAVKKNIKALGDLTNVTEADIDEFVKDKLIDFDTFATIMFDKYADHAVDVNKTLNGVLSNIKFAWSKIGADFFEPIIRNEGELVGVLDVVRAKINELRTTVKPVSEMFAGLVNDNLAKLKPMIEGLDVKKFAISEDIFNVVKYAFENIRDTVGGVAKAIKFAFDYMRGFDMSPLQHLGDTFRKITFNVGEFFEKLKPTREESVKISYIFEGIIAVFDILKKTLGAVIKPFGILFKGMGDGAEKVLDLTSSWGYWLKELDETLTKTKAFEKISKAVTGQLEGIIFDVKALKDVFKSTYEASGSIFNALVNTIGLAIRYFGEQILTLFGKIFGVDTERAIEAFETAIFNLQAILRKLHDTTKDFFTDVKEGKGILGSFIQSLKDFFGGFDLDTSKISDAFKEFNESVKPAEKAAAAVRTAFEIISAVLTTVWAVIKPLASSIGDVLKGLFDGFKGLMNAEDGKKAIRSSFAVIFLYELRKLVWTFKNFFPKLQSLFMFFKKGPGEGATSGFTAALTQIKNKLLDTLDAFKQNAYADYLIKLAAALLVLAIAINVIAKTDSDKLGASFAVISAMLYELVAATKVLTTTKLKGTGTGELIKLAAAVLIIAISIKKVAALDPDQLFNATSAIGIMLGELVGIALVLSNDKLSSGRMTKGLGGLIAMAIALRIVVSSIKALAKIEDPNKLYSSVALISALLLEMTGIVTLLSNGKFGGGGNMTKGLTGLIAMAVAVKILASACKSFAEMTDAGIKQGFTAISLLIAELAAFTKISSGSTNMLSIGIGLIAVAAAMKVFATAAKSFAEVGWEGLGKAGAAITVILGLVTAFEKLNKATSSGKQRQGKNGFLTSWSSSESQSLLSLGVGLIAFAAAMKIFASAAKDFAGINWEGLGKAGATITVILAEMTAVSRFADGGSMLKISAALLVFAIALDALVPAIAAMSSLSINGMLMTLVEVSGIIATLAFAAKATQSLQGAMLKLSAVLLVFGAALTLVGIGLTSLSTGVAAATLVVPQIIYMIKEIFIGILETIRDSQKLLVEVLLDLVDAILRSLADHVPNMIDSIGDLIIGIIKGLRKFLPKFITELKLLLNDVLGLFGKELGNVDWSMLMPMALSLAAFMVALAAAAKIAQQNLLGVAAIGLIIAEITLAFMTLMGLDPTSVLPISEGMAIAMLSIAAMMAIISMVPVAAAAQGIAGFAVFVGGLVAVLAILGGLNQIPGFSWLIGEGGDVLAKLGFIIGDFVGSIVSGIGVGLTSGLPEIADNLSTFMSKLEPFIEGAAKIDAATLEGVERIAAIIVLLTAADLLQGITSFITGNKTSLADFGQQLAEFGPYMKKYAESIKGIDTDAVQASASAAGAIAELASNLPNSGGVVGWFMGENDMDQFGPKMVTFGKSLKSYADAVKGIDKDAIESSVAAGQIVADLAKNLPNSGGALGFIMGDNDMDEFGAQLVPFGRYLMQYAVYVKGLDTEAVEASVAAGQMVSALATNLPNSGGAVSWFTGDNDMKTFGEQLVAFGQGFAQYSQAVAGLDIENCKAATAASGELADLAIKLQEIDTGALSLLGGDISSFAASLSTVGADCLDGFIAAFTNSGDKIATGIDTMFNLIYELMEAQNPTFKDKGKTSITKYSQGMTSGNYLVTQAVYKIVNLATTIFSTNVTYQKFWNYGRYVVIGFAEGMESGLDRVRAAANEMVRVASNATQYAAQIASPSKLFKKLGKFIPQGFAIGIIEDTDDVRDAVENMVSSSSDALNEAMNEMIDALNADMDMEPRITPVIDMSKIQNGAKEVNSLFNKSVAYNAMRVSNAALSFNGAKTANSPVNNNAAAMAADGSKTINFTQNNYSPKALSRTEIYRQTKNQISQLRGV